MPYKKFEDASYFGKLFQNHRFKKMYSDYINGLMMRLYKPIGKWDNLHGAEGNRGVVNTGVSLEKAEMSKEVREFYISVYDNMDPQWSLLNYVNTHWTSLMHVVNIVNYWISTNQIKNEDFFTFESDWYRELDRLCAILNRTGQFIFMPDHNLKVFWRIMGAIARSTYYGNKGENKTLEYLSDLGDISDIVKSQPGQRVDTHRGVDIQFKLNGIPKKLQCKWIQRVNLRDGQFIFTVSNPKWYDVDFFSFVNDSVIFVFDTAKEGLRYKYIDGTGDFVFDERLLKFKKDI